MKRRNIIFVLLAGALFGNLDRLAWKNTMTLRHDCEIISVAKPKGSTSSINGTIHKDSKVTILWKKGTVAYIRLDTLVPREVVDDASN